MYPAGALLVELMRATKAAHKGATALVPPNTALVPSTRTSYPVWGAASPATSGTPRLLNACFAPPLVVLCSPSCQDGTAKKLLTPPPPAPPFAPSFHTTSLTILVPEARRLVPPHASAYGLEAGESTWSAPSFTPSLEPSSPDATHTVIPMAAASLNAWSNAVIACSVQEDSGPPQLIEITEGLCVVSWIAVVTASRKPADVFGAKYTAMLALGAIAPLTSISSITSPSGPLGSPVG